MKTFVTDTTKAIAAAIAVAGSLLSAHLLSGTVSLWVSTGIGILGVISAYLVPTTLNTTPTAATQAPQAPPVAPTNLPPAVIAPVVTKEGDAAP